VTIQGAAVVVGRQPATRPATVIGGGQVRGRDAQMRELYLAHYGQLAGWCARLVDDRELAQEFATEAFTRLLARWTTVTEPRAWLYMTVTNLVRDHWRRLERERRALAKMGTADAVQPAHDPGVRDLVERLPDRLRSVVLLHYYADLSVRDVAAVLGKAEGSVKRSLYDARQALLAALEDVR
jgi:RNA polymerase sigma-70 factor (ECF subfamily)